ncbi:MAG: DUF4249 domain-containing protein [Bacteroidales bacterium]|nr:DUF4249 domain-containing protein [Bacteroidales bacterium]
MKKKWWKPLILLFTTGILFTCIDPYTPKLDDFQSILVVDALLTDENISNYVKLSRTIRTLDEDPAKVSGAVVTITDDLGKSTTLCETSAGIYKTDSLSFRGETGRAYTLYINTNDGKEYKSEPGILYPVDDIDSIYFEKDTEISNVTSESLEGIRIYIDSNHGNEGNYYRWACEEWWKFSVPDPSRYEYLNDSTFPVIDKVRQICWGNHKSDEIMVESTTSGNSGSIQRKPMLFVPSDTSSRLSIRYCIQIKQMSISQKEYEFWTQMKQINESGGDIFDKQPFRIFSNIYNINDPDEAVLGYFQVSGVCSRMKYINYKDIKDLHLPMFRYSCESVEKSVDDYPPPLSPGGGMTWDKIYAIYTSSGYLFVEPVLNKDGEMIKLAFVSSDCADCTLHGNLKKPDFWIDSE